MTSFIVSSAITTFISATLSIWSIICMWIMFKKAGRKGWESLIPIRNVYLLFKIAGKKSWFWALLLVPILWIIVSLISRFTLRSGDINEYSSIYTIRNMINRILGLLAFILPLMAWITLPYGLTKKFGQSNWFYIGMLFLTPIFFGILAFGDAKYEGAEFNEKYDLKKWILITIGISLVIGCCHAGIKYYQYKDFYSYFYGFDSEFNDEGNINKNDYIEKDDLNIDIENNNINQEITDVSNEIKDEIENNIAFEEFQGIRVNYNDIKKDDSGYKPTNKPWIDNIVKDYKGNIIMGSDFIDETKDGFYSVYTRITKRTLYINDEYNFTLMIGPEKVGYTMEISYNDINEPDSIHLINESGELVEQIIISPREDCSYIQNSNWNNLEFNEDYIFVTNFYPYYNDDKISFISTNINLIKDKKHAQEVLDKKDYCNLFSGIVNDISNN